MQLENSELGNGVVLLKLTGSMDIMGVQAVETPFAALCSGENARVVVDLSGVDYLASIGIRLLTLNAKSMQSRGGRMVLLQPNADVKNVLEMTGIIPSIPAYENMESALAVLG